MIDLNSCTIRQLLFNFLRMEHALHLKSAERISAIMIASDFKADD